MSELSGPDADLPLEQSEDDTDHGWGEQPAEADDERIAREKPPHY